MANSPGRFGAYYRTKVILVNSADSDLELVARLYGPNGLVERRTRSIEANHFLVWNNFLDDFFDYRGAGAVEFSGNAPFTVSAEVYTTSPQGTFTTVVHNGPTPLTPRSSWATNVGGITVTSSTRTNAGVFNYSNRRQTVTASVYYSGAEEPDETIMFSLPPKGWAQKSVSARGVRGHIAWRIPREAYLWVVSVDNGSNDGTLAYPTGLCLDEGESGKSKTGSPFGNFPMLPLEVDVGQFTDVDVVHPTDVTETNRERLGIQSGGRRESPANVSGQRCGFGGPRG